ncbi:MAG: carboxypeptidase-like regulatory domain-containing protein [Cyclobacteriaceae bacterium]|nr:carboxypeptidase-like regulatory domain-containing protein [Cyclobacteriaceae bacterium]
MRLIFLTLLALPFSLKGQSQIITLSGIVLDSTSLQPLAYAAIQIKNKSMGLSTKEDGTFSIETSLGDTLVFTRLGHKPILFNALKNQNNLRIILAEDARLLKDVTVYGDYNIDGVDDWKKNLPANTQIKMKNQPLTPEPGSIATFGPGISIGIGGKDKTKNRRDELSKTEVYRKTITSPEVRKQVMELYGISEETFNKKLERFNFQYPEAPYLDSQKEIVTLLIQFFALKE